MKETKYQIFISSTYEDLKDARNKVQDAILSMFHFPVGMELFGAADETQWEIIKRTIDSSDYYVLIIGMRYGSVIEEEPYKGMSYTEREFRYAMEQGVPILVFIKDESVLYHKDDIESDAGKQERLRQFKEEVKKGRTVDFWTTEDELAQQVTASLYKEFTWKPRAGWIRGDRINPEESLREISALSEENRKLREELADLRAKVSDRMPKLKVSLNEGRALRIEKKEISRDNWIFGEYLPLSMKDAAAEIRGKVTQQQLDEYNKQLPSREAVENYIEELYVYQCMKENVEKLQITLVNDGTQKARDINVELQFPKEIRIVDEGYLRSLKEPKAPKCKENPIDAAYRETVGGMAAAFHVGQQLTFLDTEPLPAIDLSSLYAKNSRCSIEDNRLELWRNDLLHGYHYDYDRYSIVPLETGTFTIHCSVMCEEYRTPQEFEIPIEVFLEKNRDPAHG